MCMYVSSNQYNQSSKQVASNRHFYQYTRGISFFFKVTKFTKLWQHKVIVTESYICLWLGDRYHVICVTVCMSPIGWQFSRDLFNIVYMWHPLLLGRLSCCCHWQESLCFVCIRTNVYVLKFINKTWKTYLYIYQTTFNIYQTKHSQCEDDRPCLCVLSRGSSVYFCRWPWSCR